MVQSSNNNNNNNHKNVELQQAIDRVLQHEDFTWFEDLFIQRNNTLGDDDDDDDDGNDSVAEEDIAIRRVNFGDYHYYIGQDTGLQLQPSLFRWFLRHGVNINNTTNSQGETLLHYSCRMHRYYSIEWVLSRTKNNENNIVQVDVKDNQGRTPLHVACREGQYDLVKLLLGQRGGANLFALDNQDRDCVYWAAWRRYHPTFLVRSLQNTKTLIRMITCTDDDGNTARATSAGKIMASLCWKDDLFVNVTVPTSTGETLFRALCNRVGVDCMHSYNISAIVALVKRGVDVQDKESNVIQNCNDEDDDFPFALIDNERPKKKRRIDPHPHWHAALLPWLRPFTTSNFISFVN